MGGGSSSPRSQDGEIDVGPLGPVHVGDVLQLHGMGRRWEGRVLGARVVDVRKSDATVKVQYLDGGYKRFTAKELCEVIAKRPKNSQSLKDFHVGQRLVLASGRCSSDRFVAVVVDLRQSDDTVKLRYVDGGFRRLSVAELEMLMLEDADSEGWEKWSVGQYIYLAGSGKWWAGRSYGATIVDIRESDSTVKVQFSTGGFKRLPMDDFKQLVAEHPPVMLEEWQTSSPVDHISEPDPAIMLAMRNRKDSETETDAASNHHESAQQLRASLKEAVSQAEYLKAHWIQQELHMMGEDASDAPNTALASPFASEVWQVVRVSANHALCGGVAGASAMALQITSLMWLRTIMNFQYRYGLSIREATQALYAQGGIRRFYQGISPALVQGPLMRFGDSASNAGVLAFFGATNREDWPVWFQTIFASASAASIRIALMPLDAVKTVLQVDGKQGLASLLRRFQAGGSAVLFRGAMASSAATFVSHYPWFTVFNQLNDFLPHYDSRSQQLLRNASIGFCASVCSDTVSNSLRVLKTHRQTREHGSYLGLAQSVIRKDGLSGLLSRGLATRIAANGISGMVFSVLYRVFEEPLLNR